MFFFWCLHIFGGPCWLGRDCASQGWLIPLDSKFVGESTFHIQTNQSGVHTLSHLLYLTHTPSQYFPCPKSTLGQVPDSQGQPLCPAACWNYSDQPILICLPCSALPTEAPRGLWPLSSPCSFPPPDQHGCFRSPKPLVSRGTVSNVKLFFERHCRHSVTFINEDPGTNDPRPTPHDGTNLCSVSVNLSLWILDIACKWNHTICGLSCLASFTSHNDFKVNPCCSVCQYVPPFYGWIVLNYMLPFFISCYFFLRKFSFVPEYIQ